MIGQQVRQGGEMHWFHSVTIGGSVCSVRKKLHIPWKVVNSFSKIKMSKFSNFTLSFYERKLIFVKQNGQW